MLDWRALALAASLAVGSSGAARAVDLPPAPRLPSPAPAAEDFSGFYLRGDVGAGINVAPNLETTPNPVATGVASGYLSPFASQAFNNTTLSPSGMIDFGAGYQFNNWFRADATLEYRGGAALQSLFTLTDPASPAFGGPLQYADFYRGDVSSLVGLVNGYVTLPEVWGVAPFVGAGIGFADNMVSGFTDQSLAYASFGSVGSSGGYFSNNSKTNFAWALMAGLDFALAPNLKLEFGYRYLNMGSISTGGSNCLAGAAGGAFNAVNCNGGVLNHVRSRNALASNDIRIGLIWMLGAPAASAPISARY
jgi:opacity protein-like surface antigen